MSIVAKVIELVSHDRDIALVRRFDHGSGGTSLALLDGNPVVVKAWPSSQLREHTLTTGLQCADTMAARHVPIPRLLERGTIADYSYVIYEFVEGVWPPTVEHRLARQMLGLIDRQRDAAVQARPHWSAELATMIIDGDATLDIDPARLQNHPAGEAILTATRTALEACDPRDLRTTDIVHGDFAPENLLVCDGKIAAVLDWEQSRVGDATFDLAGMIYDIELGNKADPDVLSGLYRAIQEQVPLDAWRLYTWVYAIRYASWAITTDMETEVLNTISRINARVESRQR